MATATPALAQVYKWVDERGVTHYGERPPQDRKASEVPNKLGSPAPEGATAQPKDQGPREGQLRAEKAEDRQKQEATRRQEQCNQQRDLLARLKQGSGNSDAIARQEKLVAEQCRS
jgi:hypothetical protein